MTAPTLAPPEAAGGLVPPPDASPAPDAPAAPPAPRESRADALRRWLPAASIVLLVLLASATSLANGFAYDDRWIVETNPRIQDLGRWWRLFGESYWPRLSNGLYRPLTSLSFMLEWAAGSGKPMVFHAVNVALYAATSVAVFRVARLLLPLAAAWVVAALFAVHPVHVEAVGNIVGQSELTGGLLVVIAMELYLRWRASAEGITPRRLLAMSLLSATACLFKENAIVLVALLGAAEVTVVRDARPWRTRLAAVRPLFMALVLVGIVYLCVRVAVLGEVGGDSAHPALVGVSMGGRVIGMLGLVPEFARLLLWPAELFADYSPRHVVFATTPTPLMVPGLAIVIGLVLLFAVSLPRRPVAAFGLLWFAISIAPVSNVLIPTGILVAERTLFTPGIGVLLAIGALLAVLLERRAELPPRLPQLAGAAIALLLVLGIWRSVDRHRVWHDNDILFKTMVEDEPLSAKAHYAYGGWLFAHRRNLEAEREWRMSIALQPDFYPVQVDLAENYRAAKLCGPAEALYRNVLGVQKDHARARVGLALCLASEGHFDDARREARLGYATGVSPDAFRTIDRYVADRRAAAARGDTLSAPQVKVRAGALDPH